MDDSYVLLQGFGYLIVLYAKETCFLFANGY